MSGLKLSQLPLLVLICLTIALSVKGEASDRPPNFVIIFLDDSGWGDFEPFGKPKYKTPHVEQLANAGCRYENFYVPQAVCSASRAALMTGCYPGRTKVFGAHPPKSRGLDPKYATLAEVLKPRGYRTAMFGKWHLGDQPDTRPPARGFDESAGLMYSNDMWEFHPENSKYWGKYPLQYWENGKVTIERMTKDHQSHLTTWYTEKAVDFIKRQGNAPFLLYVPHSMPHVPIFCSDKFKGKSGAGLYGDVIMELDWSVGEIVKALQAAGVSENTVVLFTSDNGPWITYGNRAGVTPFREAKGTSFDGGIRSACIIKYPPAIPAGTSSTRAFCTLDILPTFAALAGASLPDNPVDGANVWDLITGKPGAKNPNEYYPFSNGFEFQGVLSGDGKWKLHLPHVYRTLESPGRDGIPGKYRHAKIGWSLFNMDDDPYELRSVMHQQSLIAAHLKTIAERHLKRFYPQQEN
ncbi:MAG: Arylsulfatase [Verrucomicrobia subdivision 3 bacterium]|nr:Arylsulfatase [Limisphaerales bacterium]MCS1417098.1 Arylsulfatase [Limisphaerales bacterium]